MGILDWQPNSISMPREEKLCAALPTISPPKSYKVHPSLTIDNNGHSYEVDIWSLGVIAYAFVVGRPPFETNDVKTTYSKIKSCNYCFPDTVQLSKMVRKFISKMLIRDPSRRATIDEVLSDEFFTESQIPQSLPISFLACPPNSAFMKQYSEKNDDNRSTATEAATGHQTSRGIS